MDGARRQHGTDLAGAAWWRRALAVLVPAVLVCLLAGGRASAQPVMREMPEALAGLDVTERLGERVPLDLAFVDEQGRPVTLRECFASGRPVVLAMVYYRCPMLCPMVLGKLQETLRALDFSVGREFDVVVVSFDPTEGPEHAAKERAATLLSYDRPDRAAAERGFRFLTGEPEACRALADAIGFSYRYLPKANEYAHPSVLFVLTPEGVIARYLYGVQYPVSQLRLALLEASAGRIGTTIDRVILFCYHFDPNAGVYVLQAFRVMQVGAVLTAVALAVLIGALVVGERRRRSGARRRGVDGRTALAAGTGA